MPRASAFSMTRRPGNCCPARTARLGVWAEFGRSLLKEKRLSDSPVTFVAHASHAGEGAEAAEGRIVFDRWRLRFESAALTLEIPLTRLQIEIVEAEAGAIYF